MVNRFCASKPALPVEPAHASGPASRASAGAVELMKSRRLIRYLPFVAILIHWLPFQ
ncbi:MAG: hypothetical protein ACI8ZT_002525 [Bacteroidia bacterium]|jgi:hypothetical protein